MNAHGPVRFQRQNSKRLVPGERDGERQSRRPSLRPLARRPREHVRRRALPADVRIAAFRSGQFLGRQRADGASGSDLAGTCRAGTRRRLREVVDVEAAARSAPNSVTVLAGEACNERQLQLSSEVAWTGGYPAARSNYGLPIRGEICQDPVMARVMMSRRQKSQMTIPARPMDFRNETEWRLKLRGGLGPVPLH